MHKKKWSSTHMLTINGPEINPVKIVKKKEENNFNLKKHVRNL